MERLSKKPTKCSYFLRCIFCYTQVFGFTPFGFDTVKVKAITSKGWSFYSKLFTVTLSSFSIFYLQFYSALVMYTKFSIPYAVQAVDLYGNALKMLVSYWIQIYNRKALIETMNMAIVIRNNLRYVSPGEVIFAKSFWKHIRRVLLILLVQSILFTWYCFEAWHGLAKQNTAVAYIDFLLENYCHLGVSIIILKIFYNTGMVMGIRLYEIVNDRISEILSRTIVEFETRNLICTEVDQDIDQLMLIFAKITYMVDTVNKLFATQIMFVIVGCFLSILSSVSYDECFIFRKSFLAFSFLRLFFSL